MDTLVTSICGAPARTLADDVEGPDHGAQRRSRLDAALNVGLFARQNFVAHVLQKNLVAQPDQPQNAVVHDGARRNEILNRWKALQTRY